jgi:hypothetical protein
MSDESYLGVQEEWHLKESKTMCTPKHITMDLSTYQQSNYIMFECFKQMRLGKQKEGKLNENRT